MKGKGGGDDTSLHNGYSEGIILEPRFNGEDDMKTSKILRDVSRNTGRMFDVVSFLNPPMPIIRPIRRSKMVIRTVEENIASDLDAIRGDYERVIARYEQEHASA